jgi:hypothetical protein
MSDPEVEAKFHALAERHVSSGRREELLRWIWKLEELDSVSEILNVGACEG